MALRILFINAWDTKGGAAIAMNRLRKALSERHHVSEILLVGFRDAGEAGTFPTRGTIARQIEGIINKFFNWVGLQYQFFPFSARTIKLAIREFKPDVISLHNTHGGYFPLTVLPKISARAPVVWTLHDMWAFTGNSAHTFGDESWVDMKNSSHLTGIYPAIGLNTGRWLLRQKKKLYEHSDLTLVTPSHWLLGLVQRSPVLQKKRVHHIFNGVDLTVFYVRDKNLVRDKLSIPRDSRVIMFSADSLTDNPWKGGKDLVTVLSKLDEGSNGKVHLIITGAGDLEALRNLKNLVVHATGFVSDQETMAQYFSATDLFLYPTRADNLPNVLVEAIACAVPCVTFDVGGCGDIIQHEYNGLLIPPFDLERMARQVVELLGDKARLKLFSDQARVIAEEKFSVERMAERYYVLFRSIERRTNL